MDCRQQKSTIFCLEIVVALLGTRISYSNVSGIYSDQTTKVFAFLLVFRASNSVCYIGCTSILTDKAEVVLVWRKGHGEQWLGEIAVSYN